MFIFTIVINIIKIIRLSFYLLDWQRLKIRILSVARVWGNEAHILKEV